MMMIYDDQESIHPCVTIWCQDVHYIQVVRLINIWHRVILHLFIHLHLLKVWCSWEGTYTCWVSSSPWPLCTDLLLLDINIMNCITAGPIHPCTLSSSNLKSLLPYLIVQDTWVSDDSNLCYIDIPSGVLHIKLFLNSSPGTVSVTTYLKPLEWQTRNSNFDNRLV